MKRVKIFHVADDGSMHVACLAELREGEAEVSFQGPLADVYSRDFRKEGIWGRWGIPYFPSDGTLFLENLKYEFTGSRVRAGDVEEVPE